MEIDKMSTDLFNQHSSKRFNEELEALRNSVMRMGGLVEKHLHTAIESIIAGDSEMALEVAQEDYKINAMEVEIDENCNRILATRSPAAADLRLIVAVIKTITDLERIGDEAQRISFLASRLASDSQPQDHYRELKALGEHVLSMLHDSLDSFSRLDAKDALAVVEEDKLVDEQYDMITRQCLSLMIEDPGTIKRFMDVTWVARALERIGDHAQNIAEYVIYLAHGRDIRHIKLEEVRQKLSDS